MYIEAEKEVHVKDAIRGIRNFFASKPIKLVPLNEMVEAISVNRKAKQEIGAQKRLMIVQGGREEGRCMREAMPGS